MLELYRSHKTSFDIFYWLYWELPFGFFIGAVGSGNVVATS